MRAAEICQALGGRLLGEDVELKALAPLYCASKAELAMVAWPKDTKLVKKSNAGCLITLLDWAADHADEVTSSLIVVNDLHSTFLVIKGLQAQGFLRAFEPISSASIDVSAFIAPSANIGYADIGKNVRIGSHSVVGDDVAIGDDSIIQAGVVIHGPTRIGKRAIIGSNSVIGSEAFVPYEHRNLVSVGGVHIGDDVELGALCTVDKGLIGVTRIMNQARLDNMVHCGHDSYIGFNVVIAAQSGLAGFVQVGENVTIGGQSGIAPQVVVGPYARLSGKSFAHCDIKAFEIWSGNPGLPHSQYLREYARAKRCKRDR